MPPQRKEGCKEKANMATVIPPSPQSAKKVGIIKHVSSKDTSHSSKDACVPTDINAIGDSSNIHGQQKLIKDPTCTKSDPTLTKTAGVKEASPTKPARQIKKKIPVGSAKRSKTTDLADKSLINNGRLGKREKGPARSSKTPASEMSNVSTPMNESLGIEQTSKTNSIGQRHKSVPSCRTMTGRSGSEDSVAACHSDMPEKGISQVSWPARDLDADVFHHASPTSSSSFGVSSLRLFAHSFSLLKKKASRRKAQPADGTDPLLSTPTKTAAQSKRLVRFCCFGRRKSPQVDARQDVSMFMTIGEDVNMLKTQYLAGFKEDKIATYPTVPILDVRVEPTCDGTIADLHQQHPDLERCLFNDVKMCSSCGKACAYTLVDCNSCGKPLPETLSKSENVFAAFLFGVKLAAKGFPYKISLRRETEDVLIFDDMLQLTPLHLNGIPKKYYIRDWRFLLPCPRKSLELLDTLETELWEATKVFLADPAFRKTIYKSNVTDEQIRNNIICSFNLPPSQFHLHVQWLVPPLVPFHHMMAVERNHFHEGRAFPLSYVKKCLALDQPYEVTQTTPVDDIIEHFKGLGVDYNLEWTAWYEEVCLAGSEALQNWSHNDFDYVVDKGKAYNFTVEGGFIKLGTVQDADISKIQIQDNDRLRQYGRPYSSDGKPAGTYIQKPLQPRFGEGGFLPFPPATC